MKHYNITNNEQTSACRDMKDLAVITFTIHI